MKRIRNVSMIALGGLCLFLVDSGSRGQRFGGRGGGRAAAVGARGGAAVGPYGGAGAGTRTTQTVVGPRGQTTVGSGRGSYTTPGGTTIDYGAAGRKATGPGGVTAGRGVGAIQITGPDGQEYAKVGAARGAVGPNGRRRRERVHRRRPGPERGGRLDQPRRHRGWPERRRRRQIADRRGDRPGRHGRRRSANRRGRGAERPCGLHDSRGGRRTPDHLRRRRRAARTQGVYVRRSFVHYDCFRPNWYVAHPHAWRAAAWTATAFWAGATWGRLSAYCGYPPAPVVYNYGSTIVYQDNSVYYNGEPVATAEEYAQQAAAIADQGEQAQPGEKEEWVSLGVFGMVRGDDTDANQIFQLAINKDGVLRGNYYDALSDSTLPVFGAVDKKTQRAAWTVGDRKDTVYENGRRQPDRGRDDDACAFR